MQGTLDGVTETRHWSDQLVKDDACGGHAATMLGTGDIIGEGIQLTQRNSTTADDDNGGGPEGRVPLREEAPVSHHGNQQALEGLGGADTNKVSSQGAKNENSYGPVDHRLVQEILSSMS